MLRAFAGAAAGCAGRCRATSRFRSPMLTEARTAQTGESKEVKPVPARIRPDSAGSEGRPQVRGAREATRPARRFRPARLAFGRVCDGGRYNERYRNQSPTEAPVAHRPDSERPAPLLPNARPPASGTAPRARGTKCRHSRARPVRCRVSGTPSAQRPANIRSRLLQVRRSPAIEAGAPRRGASPAVRGRDSRVPGPRGSREPSGPPRDGHARPRASAATNATFGAASGAPGAPRRA